MLTIGEQFFLLSSVCVYFRDIFLVPSFWLNVYNKWYGDVSALKLDSKSGYIYQVKDAIREIEMTIQEYKHNKNATIQYIIRRGLIHVLPRLFEDVEYKIYKSPLIPWEHYCEKSKTPLYFVYVKLM